MTFSRPMAALPLAAQNPPAIENGQVRVLVVTGPNTEAHYTSTKSIA